MTEPVVSTSVDLDPASLVAAHPLVAAAAPVAAAAKAAYRADPSEQAKAAHKQASEELRYARWVARGGPAQVQAAIDAEEETARVYLAKGLDPPPSQISGPSLAHLARFTTEQATKG